MQSHSLTGFFPFPPEMGKKAHIPNECRPEMRRLKSRICFSAPCAKLVFAKLITNYFYASALEMFTYKTYFLNSCYCHFFFFFYKWRPLYHFLQAAQDFGFANFIVAMKTFRRLMSLKRTFSHLHISVLHYMVTKFFLQTFFILLKSGLAMVAEESTFLQKMACCT